MRGRVLPGGVVAVGLLLLTGCSPEQKPLVAVRLDAEGTAQVLLRPCDGDDRVRGPQLVVTPAGEERTGDNESGWDADGRNRIADFPLFAPPAEWKAKVSGPQTLRPGYDYDLRFGDPDNTYAYIGVVHFRAPYLQALEPGEVWADDRAMPREEFEELADDAC
ncbi:hypothetical protein ACF08N_30855 [Streptomyces sp. NPDC015127]|uniref:hypothetical protein n=1 Tax=Streptomyces sp. NPDC015127 TaxID=3364939 RepID=UPI0036F6D8AB